MKKFINEYINVIIYVILGLTFMITSFYLLINYYHSVELKDGIYVSSNDIGYKSYKEKISEISDNLNRFKAKKVNDKEYSKLYSKLVTCSTVLKSEGTLNTFKVDDYHNSYDIYQLGTKFQSDVLNICYALHLSYLNDETENTDFKNISPFITNTVNDLSKQVQFSLDEIKGNSSYFFSTNITSSTIRNYLVSDYQIIANSYNSFTNLVLELSKLLNERNEGEINNE